MAEKKEWRHFGVTRVEMVQIFIPDAIPDRMYRIDFQVNDTVHRFELVALTRDKLRLMSWHNYFVTKQLYDLAWVCARSRVLRRHKLIVKGWNHYLQWSKEQCPTIQELVQRLRLETSPSPLYHPLLCRNSYWPLGLGATSMRFSIHSTSPGNTLMMTPGGSYDI